MSDQRKTEDISLDEFIRRQNAGLNYRLEDIQVRGTAVIRDKHGKVKGELTLSNDVPEG